MRPGLGSALWRKWYSRSNWSSSFQNHCPPVVSERCGRLMKSDEGCS